MNRHMRALSKDIVNIIVQDAVLVDRDHRREVRVVGVKRHSESPCYLAYPLGDSPEANETETFAGQFGPSHALLCPFTRSESPVTGGDVPRGCE